MLESAAPATEDGLSYYNTVDCDAKTPRRCCVQSERGELDQMGYRWSDLQWALSVLHSRCFTMGSPALHLTAPGIDMANHTFTPNATVR